jgi:cysteine-rich repeat protein
VHINSQHSARVGATLTGGEGSGNVAIVPHLRARLAVLAVLVSACAGADEQPESPSFGGQTRPPSGDVGGDAVTGPGDTGDAGTAPTDPGGGTGGTGGTDDPGDTGDTGDTSSTGAPPVCGDAKVDPGEACDDGNAENTDSCTVDCLAAACGDGFVQPGEQCDDGDVNDLNGCSNACLLPSCGDGKPDPGEECDDGDMDDADECTSLCKKPVCGDGFVQSGETCDDGNAINTDGCVACQPPKCGDGFVQNGEQCDDGNQLSSDACTTACSNAKCGDGYVYTGVEVCDGNQVPNGQCSACKIACNPGRADCNASPGDGCEVDTSSDKNNCGGCGKSCGAGQCKNGSCMQDYGPEHHFAGLTSNHYVTQQCCSVGCQGNNAADAAYFCAHFYGPNCTPKPGYILGLTPYPEYPKMHKFGGCDPSGFDVPGTQCDGGPCKITQKVANTLGLMNLVCTCN